ncbi:MAG: IS1634 family transposase [Sphingomonadales bacterium]
MFVREKRIRGYSYLYLVESVRENGRTRQRLIKNLGRKEAVLANGDLDRLAHSVGRFAERALVLSALERGETVGLACQRIGPPLLFERLWAKSGCAAVIADLAAGRGFEFALERAVFVAVLHRLMVSGSDRACEKWMRDYRIEGAEALSLHHFYRAMAWLGEELPDADQAAPAPRCVKDLIEEELFTRRRDLFAELSVVFLDTTSLSFQGRGGETLGRRGYSKDHRPDLKQMILGVVMDQDGRPLCTEMWPGNTADVTVLLPVIDRLRSRFAIGRVCVVADRGMISTETIAGLEERGLEYILGTRERSDKLVRTVVLKDPGAFAPLTIARSARGDTELEAKTVLVGGLRYIVCRNLEEAQKDAAERQAIVTGLKKQLKRGDKALIGNSAYRRFLRTTDGRRFEIDPDKVEAEARFDGIYVLRTNTGLDPLQAMLRYRELLKVEDIFRTAKSLLRTRPIYHQSDAAIRGHVFCSFLALVLRKALMDRCSQAGFQPEWQDVRLDLDRLQEVVVARDGKRLIIRTPTTGVAGKLFRAIGIALPPNLREITAET